MNNESVYVWHCPSCGETFIRDKENAMLNAADSHLKQCEQEPLVKGGQGHTDAEVEDSGRLFGVSMWGAITLVVIALVLIFCFSGCSTVKRHVYPEGELRKIFQ